jgi:hypothetical protein
VKQAFTFLNSVRWLCIPPLESKFAGRELNKSTHRFKKPVLYLLPHSTEPYVMGETLFRVGKDAIGVLHNTFALGQFSC